MRVAVIGAGAGGLAAAKGLLECGLEPIVFEGTEAVGGLWVYRELQADGGPAYRSLRTNTSKEITAFSDAPMSCTLPYFPHRSEIEGYLQSYTRRFDIAPRIRFGCRVEAIRAQFGGGWRLTVGSGGVESDEFFDAVMVASGIFHHPVLPVLPGTEMYRGNLQHSASYRNPEPYQGQRVVVVGLGSSAVDIAAELTTVAHTTILSTRRGAWINPRLVDGRPFDHRATRLRALRPTRVRTRSLRERPAREYARRGVPPIPELWARFGIPFEPSTAPAVTSEDLPPLMLSGKLRVRSGIERLTAEGVRFLDGTEQAADSIILCTGYELDFPFLAADLQPWSSPSTGLYRLVFLPQYPTLAFIGVCRVQGPVLPIVEMQARWAAQTFIGAVRLPDEGTMLTEIARRRQVQLAKRDSLLRVALVPYLDQLGAEIGVRPHLWRHPTLAGPLLLGPPAAAQYRLEGPNAWAGAADHLRQIQP